MKLQKIRAFKILFNQLSKEFDQTAFLHFTETFLESKNDEENNLIRSTLELPAMIAGSDAVLYNDFKVQKFNSLSEEIR